MHTAPVRHEGDNQYSAEFLKLCFQDTEDLTAICLTPDSSTLILSSRSLSLRIFSLSFQDSVSSSDPTTSASTSTAATASHQLVRTVPTLHASSLTLIVSDPDSNFIATGSTDGTTKIWDLKKGYCTHFLKSISGGVISSICWDVGQSHSSTGKGKESVNGLGSSQGRLHLIIGSVDGSIRVWDLLKSSSSSNDKSKKSDKETKPIQILSNGHVSPVRGLGISKDGLDLLSGSRDKTIVRWRLKKANKSDDWRFHLMETITVGESVESLAFIQNPKSFRNQVEDHEATSYFWSGGEKGEIKLWSLPISSTSPSSTSGSASESDQGLKLSFIQPGSSKSEGVSPANRSDQDSEEDTRAITEVHQVFDKSQKRVDLVSIHSDQTISFRNGPPFGENRQKTAFRPLGMIRQLIGFNDEIVDLALLAPNGYAQPEESATSSDTPNQVQPMPTETHLAIATNSSYPRIYSIANSGNRKKGSHVEILRGGKKPKDRHEDMILCLDKSHDDKWLMSGSKDKSARLWTSRRIASTSSSKKAEREGAEVDDEGRIEWYCNAVAEGHAESVGALAVARRALAEGGSTPFMITGSSDKTVKLWDLTSLTSQEGSSSSDETPTPVKLRSLLTLKIHDKDINTLDISPNNALLISGSQDKTAKVFSLSFSKSKSSKSSKESPPAIASLKQIAICTGHKRGVWSVKFSPIDAAFATSSGDKTIRLWSLKDFSCVKVFDSHSHSVLRIDFLNRGTQLLSAGAEGVVKLWNIRDEENVWNKEVLGDRIWGLKVMRGGKSFVAAGADGNIKWFKDDTKEKIEVEGKKREVMVQQEQDFSNYLSIQDYKNAISLALNMNQPRRLFFLFTSVSNSRPDVDEIKLLFGEDSPPTKTSRKKPDASDEPLGATQLLNTVLNLDTRDSKKRKEKQLTSVEQRRLEDYNSITGSKSVDLIIRNLPKHQLNQLMIYIRDWNTSYKTSGVAQEILHAILRYKTSTEIREAFNNDRKFHQSSHDDDDDDDEDVMEVNGEGEESRQISKLNAKRDGISKVKDLGELLDGIIPYTQRHLGRSDRNLMESKVLDYTLKCMDQILGEDESQDEDDAEDEDGDDESESESESDEERAISNGQGKELANGKVNGRKVMELDEDDSEEDESEPEDVEMRE